MIILHFPKNLNLEKIPNIYVYKINELETH
jgi:hypothetical protein